MTKRERINNYIKLLEKYTNRKVFLKEDLTVGEDGKLFNGDLSKEQYQEKYENIYNDLMSKTEELLNDRTIDIFSEQELLDPILELTRQIFIKLYDKDPDDIL